MGTEQEGGRELLPSLAGWLHRHLPGNPPSIAIKPRLRLREFLFTATALIHISLLDRAD